ncbi:MAG TPA: ABC transporter six-transmembrane domain-containing protein [Gemmatimonadales bacterium]|nr:ABC transporter six-transmembrane domain-containing protein [Gemmatimonadales bacterium]
MKRGTPAQLIQLFGAYRGLILLALSLVLVENVAWILEPYLFGPVLDALIGVAAKERPRGAAVLPMVLWVGAFAVNSGVGTLRRSLDPRIYLRVYADIAAGVVRSGREQRLAPGVMAARAQLAREFISFLEYSVPETLEHAIAIGGALVGLTLFDVRIALACALVIVPLLLIRRIYGRRVLGLQREVHDRLEAAFDTIQGMDPEQVRGYYMEVAGPQQRIANWGATSFGLMRLVLLGVFLVVLFVAIDLDDFSTGQLYSIVAYLWTFVTSSEYLPELLESWTSVKDLNRRLRSGS